MSTEAGRQPRGRPIISFNNNSGTCSSRERATAMDAAQVVDPTLLTTTAVLSDNKAQREARSTPPPGSSSAVPQMDEHDEFSGALNSFARELRGLAVKLADERHLREDGVPGPHLPQCTATETSAFKAAEAAAVGKNALHCHSQSTHAAPPSMQRHSDSKRSATKPAHDTSCVQDVALNIWATLGFFSLPPFEVDPPVEQVESRERRLPHDGVAGSASLQTESGDAHEDEESIFSFVSALEKYYQQTLTSLDASPSRVQQQQQQEEQRYHSSDEMLRRGLWHVLFNAVFYCVTAPGTRQTFTAKDLECLTGGVEDRYDVVYDDFSLLSEDSGEADDNDDNGYVPVRLQWHTRSEIKEGTEIRRQRQQQRQQKPQQLGHREPHHRLTPASLRESCRHSELDGAIEERRQRSSSSIGGADATGSSTSKRAELLERLRRRTTPFGGRLEVPPPITSWYFVVRTLAQLGYKRDTFYEQTPLNGSIHELLLALLWITKEYQLVAVAEYVQLQRMGSFLLRQVPVVGDEQDGTDNCNETVEAECNAAVRKDSAGSVLLRCFPDAVPWPPASFVEKEYIGHRLEQLQQLLPLDQEGNITAATAEMSLPDLTRRVLSMQRLITLSLNRLECALHQRAEQTVALGLHATLDAQICHPKYHNAYRQLCQGLQHLRGMDSRMRSSAQQLARLGSLVARCLTIEAASRQQQKLNADLMSAIADDESTWQQHKQQQRKWQQHEGDAGADGDMWRLQNVLTRFRATRMKEQLSDLWASLRRSARVGGAGSDSGVNVAGSAKLQAQLEAQVEHNMAIRYSLDAALKAELRIWQLRGVDAVQKQRQEGGEDDGNGDDEDASEEILLPLRDTGGGHHSRSTAKKGNKKKKAPLVTFDTVLTDAAACSAQATAVGQPASNATTSARLEVARLREALSALRQQPECREKHAEEMQMERNALEFLHCRSLRVVQRKH